jgi:hypothetical protein
MIIDCYCHYVKGDGLTGPWDTDAAGIERKVRLLHLPYKLESQVLGGTFFKLSAGARPARRTPMPPSPWEDRKIEPAIPTGGLEVFDPWVTREKLLGRQRYRYVNCPIYLISD